MNEQTEKHLYIEETIEQPKLKKVEPEQERVDLDVDHSVVTDGIISYI